MVVDVIFIWGIDSTVCVFVQCVLLFLQDICMGFYKLRFTSDIHFYSVSRWHCYAAQ